MTRTSQDDVTAELATHLGALRRILVDGVEDYLSRYGEEERLIHCATTKAGIIHDHQVARAAKYAVTSSGQAKLLNFSGLRVLAIGRCAIRFKKFDDELLSCNLQTKQIVDFRRQNPLPGMPPTVNLECGYVLDESGVSVSGTWLVQPSGRGVRWAHRLYDSSVKPVVENLFEYMNHEEEETEGESGAIIVPKVVPIRKDSDED